MKRVVHLTLTAAFLAAVSCPQRASAQYGDPKPATSRPEKTPARAPIPPGVPTNADNVHLPTEGEVKLGRQTAEEVEKVYKVVSSGPYHERLQRIAQDVVLALSRKDIIQEYKHRYHLPRAEDNSRRVPFEWSFHVVESRGPGKEVNAFSLAGGPVYVTKDLMDTAVSDHELAAVLAHECSHVAFHHVEQTVKKQKKLQTAQIWGLLAAVIAGAAGGGQAAAAATNIMMGAQLVSIATLTGYSRELETEADFIGVKALAGTDYNPVGMMTFMQKLQKEDVLHGNPDYAIYQTHPYSNQRVAAIKKQVEALGYRADPGVQRQVAGTFRVTSEPQRVGGKPAYELRLNGSVLFTVVAGEGDLSPQERAQKIAAQVESLFGDNLTYNDVRRSPDKTAVLLKGMPVIRAYPDDAAVMGSAQAATDKAYNAIVRALIKEQIDKPF